MPCGDKRETGLYLEVDRLPVRLVVALLCSFMPWNFEIFIAALFSIMHVYSLSMEYAVVTERYSF
jgi:hypothetical protein